MIRRILFAALLIGAALPGVASAADFRGGEDHIVITGDVFIERGEEAETVAVVDGDVDIRGTVTDDVINLTGHTRVSGHVEGDVISITDRAHIQRGGRVDGDVIYVEEKPLVDPGAHVGEVRKVNGDEWFSPLHLFIASIAIWIAMSVSTLLLGLALLWVAPRAAEAAYAVAGPYVGQSIAAGLGALIGLPILAFLLIATLVGLPLGLVLLLLLFPLALVGYVTSAWLLGRRIAGPPRGRFISFLAGWGILRAVALLPFAGSVAWVAAAVFGIGVLAVAAWRARPGPPVEPAPAAA